MFCAVSVDSVIEGGRESQGQGARPTAPLATFLAARHLHNSFDFSILIREYVMFDENIVQVTYRLPYAAGHLLPGA